MSASPSEVRSARQFLRGKVKAGSGDIPPRHFANAGQELGLDNQSLAGVLSRLYSGGQGDERYREMAIEQGAASGK